MFAVNPLGENLPDNLVRKSVVLETEIYSIQSEFQSPPGERIPFA